MTRKLQLVSPHSLRVNDQVYQRYNPWNTGQVSHYRPGHSFTVVYDFPERKPRQPRQRFTYPISCQDNFLVGRPPVVPAPPAVGTDEIKGEK